MGKTSLVRAFADGADGAILRRRVREPDDADAARPVRRRRAQVGGELAELVGSGGHRSVALAVLAELRRPAVLVLEDLHWADEASLDVLRVLGRRIDGAPALVVATYRDDEVEGHPLARVLGELASAPGVERLSVPRLSPRRCARSPSRAGPTPRRCTS